MSATQIIERPPEGATLPKSDGEERIAIAVLSSARINNFGLLMIREAVRLALEGDGIKPEWIAGFYGHSLAGYGLPSIKGVGGFVVMFAGVEDRQGAVKALHKVVPEKTFSYEIAWWDKSEEYWRTAHSTYPALQFDRLLTKEITDDFEKLLKAEQAESQNFIDALKHCLEAADRKIDATGE
jgi:hypothetical protein